MENLNESQLSLVKKLGRLYMSTVEEDTARLGIKEVILNVRDWIDAKKYGEDVPIITGEGEIKVEDLKKYSACICAAVYLERNTRESREKILKQISQDPYISAILTEISKSQALLEYENEATTRSVEWTGEFPEHILVRNSQLRYLQYPDYTGSCKKEFEEAFADERDKSGSTTLENEFREGIKVTPEQLRIRGKHRALGDVHGKKKAYDTAMNQMRENDSMAILGDVVDRGPDGIEILLDLIDRGANTEGSNIIFLMGNHELSMLKSLKELNEYTVDQILEIIEYGRESYNTMRKISKIAGKDEREKKKREYQDSDEWKSKNRKYNLRNAAMIAHWIDEEGGLETLNEYLNLPEEEQEKIIKFLEESYIAYNQVVQGENKLYVHSRPFQDMNIIRRMKGKEGGVRYKDLDEKDAEFALWERNIDTFTPCAKEGFVTICGHTITPMTTTVNRQQGYICLDEGCGCAVTGTDTMTVGLYCIEDDQVLHIGESGEIDRKKGKIRVINKNGEACEVIGTQIPQDPIAR